jgi:voltage-gated potassium channel
VTLTTVGYGDIVPITTAGRWAAVAIMVTGIAVLGVLAGSLASFFRVDPPSEDGDAPAPSDGGEGGAPPEPVATGPPATADVAALAAEIAALRRQVEVLTSRLTPDDHA